MLRMVVRLLEIIAIFWLVWFLWRSLFGGRFRRQASQQFRTRGPFHPNDYPSEPKVVTGEMKKDPQCGTYVSTELSLKSRYRNEELHFCSRHCQEEFLQAHSGKSA